MSWWQKSFFFLYLQLPTSEVKRLAAQYLQKLSGEENCSPENCAASEEGEESLSPDKITSVADVTINKEMESQRPGPKNTIDALHTLGRGMYHKRL